MTIRKISSDAIESGSITESLLHIDVSNKVNAAYNTANTASGSGSGAYNQANNAYAQANAAYASANSAVVIGQNAYAAANSKVSSSGGAIVGDVSITGNLFVNGVQTIVNTASLTVNDPIFLLANNNTTNAVGLGFVAHYGPTQKHTGLIRAHQDNNWYLFDEYDDHILYANNVLDTGNVKLATLKANVAANTLTVLNGVSGNVNFDSGTLFVDSVGNNVGIGTASPSKALHTFSSSESLLVDGSATWGGAIQIKGGGGANTWQIQSTGTGAGEGANKLIFAQKDISATLMTITSGGNIGIGVTNPWSRLTVTATSVSWGEGITINPAPNGYSAVYFRTEAATNDSTANSWAVGKNSSGQAGGELLHVVRNGLTGSSLHRADAIQSWQPAGNSCFGFNVGIGTTNPAVRLHVFGDSYFTGGAYFLDSTIYGNYARSNNYPSKGYSGANDRFWLELGARGGVHVVLNTDGGANAAENDSDDFAIFQGSRDSGDNLFRVMNSGKVLTKHSHFIGNTHNTAQQSEFGTSAINTYLTAGTNVNTLVESYENRSGVYWLNFNGQIFRAYIKANWLQGRNWVLAAKFFDAQDMPSGSSLWTNDTYVNEGDFDIYSGKFSKYKAWRYFSFDRLAMHMGDRVAPIMQFSSNQTLFGAFSGGRAGNGGGVTASSTDPQIGNSATYHNMTNYIGPNFTDIAGSEDIMQSYGLNKWANGSTNSTSGNNQGSRSYNSGALKGYQLTIEDSHPNISGMDSVGVAGAWIGCPMDEGGFTFGSAASNGGADSGFGFGFGCGNNPRTGTSGYAEWAKGNEVVNLLPAYIWLSID